jgi:hypothetical protein
MGMGYDNYTETERESFDAIYKGIAPQLDRIKSAKTKEEKAALADAFAKSQANAIKGQKVASIVFTITAERLFRANPNVALSDDQKANMRAGKAFFSNFKEQFKDYFFERAAMPRFEPGLLQTCSELLVKFAQEDPAFRKSLIARMDTILRTKKGDVDNSVTLTTIMAPLVKATELLPLLRKLQDDPALKPNEKTLYRITEQAIQKERGTSPQILKR